VGSRGASELVGRLPAEGGGGGSLPGVDGPRAGAGAASSG